MQPLHLQSLTQSEDKSLMKNENEEELDNAPEEKDETLEYKEFGMFLHALKQYYVYCQVLLFCIEI